MPDAVSDSSPLIHLAKIEALELISRLYSRVLIPPAVWREVVEESDGRPGVLIHRSRAGLPLASGLKHAACNPTNAGWRACSVELPSKAWNDKQPG